MLASQLTAEMAALVNAVHPKPELPQATRHFVSGDSYSVPTIAVIPLGSVPFTGSSPAYEYASSVCRTLPSTLRNCPVAGS